MDFRAIKKATEPTIDVESEFWLDLVTNLAQKR